MTTDKIRNIRLHVLCQHQASETLVDRQEPRKRHRQSESGFLIYSFLIVLRVFFSGSEDETLADFKLLWYFVCGQNANTLEIPELATQRQIEASRSSRAVEVTWKSDSSAGSRVRCS